MSDMADLTDEELHRYSRHLNLPDFNLQDQKSLKNARVLVIGAGGLGSPLLQYLAAAGIGNIGIVEYDSIDSSNLQRQVLYSTADVGKKKVELARKRLLAINPLTHVNTYDEALSAANASDIFRDYDIIADGTDNFPTRYLINDVCVFSAKVNVHASVFRYQGQVSVFNYLSPEQDSEGKRGPNYRDLFPSPPRPEEVQSCEEGGILGVLPGIIGSMQALEVIKIILGKGEILSGKLLLFDGLTMKTSTVSFGKNPLNPLTGENPTIFAPVDYEEFCNRGSRSQNSVSVAQVESWIKNPDLSLQIIDVREKHEYEQFNIGGVNCPLSQPEKLLRSIKEDSKNVIHCKSGVRSRKALDWLTERDITGEIYHMEGGTEAWIRHFGTGGGQ